MRRKVAVQWKPTVKHSSLATVHRYLSGRAHKHTCTNQSCRLTYEDNCDDASVNGRCRPCTGRRRTWIDRNTGLHNADPRPCCLAGVEQMTDADELMRFECGGPGPWFQCPTCKRVHGHNCTDPDLLARPLQIHNHSEGTP